MKNGVLFFLLILILTSVIHRCISPICRHYFCFRQKNVNLTGVLGKFCPKRLFAFSANGKSGFQNTENQYFNFL
jgi:hypothetical protein